MIPEREPRKTLMQNPRPIDCRGQVPTPPRLIRPRWRMMLAASPRLRNLAACARACGHVPSKSSRMWSAIEDELLDIIGWFAADARLNSSAHWDVALRELRRLFDAGGSP